MDEATILRITVRIEAISLNIGYLDHRQVPIHFLLIDLSRHCGGLVRDAAGASVGSAVCEGRPFSQRLYRAGHERIARPYDIVVRRSVRPGIAARKPMFPLLRLSRLDLPRRYCSSYVEFFCRRYNLFLVREPFLKVPRHS